MKEKTRGKRLLSFLLCFVMIFGMLPMSAIPAQAAENGPAQGVFLDLGGTDFSQRIYLDESKPYIRAKETNYHFYLNRDIGPEASLPDNYYGSFIRYSPDTGSLYICNNTVNGYYFNVPSIFVTDTSPKDITIDIYGKVKLYKPQPYNGSTSTTAATALIVNASGGNITINGMKKNGANSILSIATADGRNSGFLNTHMGAYIDLDGTGSLTLGGNLDCYMKVQHQQNPISVYVPGSFNVTENASLSIENESKASSDSDLPTVVPINASEFVVDTTKKVDISARNLVNGSAKGPVEMIHGKFVAKNAEIVKLYYPGQVSDSTVVATDGVEEIGLERVNQNGLTINFIKNPGKKPFPTEIFIGNETFSDTNKYYYNGIGFVSEKIGLRAPEAEYDYATGTLALEYYDGPQITILGKSDQNSPYYNSGGTLVYEETLTKNLKIELYGDNKITCDASISLIPYESAGIYHGNEGGISFIGSGTLTIESPSGDEVAGYYGIKVMGRKKLSYLTFMNSTTVNINNKVGAYNHGVWVNASTSDNANVGQINIIENATLNVDMQCGTSNSMYYGIYGNNITLNTDGDVNVQMHLGDAPYALYLRGVAENNTFAKVNHLYLKANQGSTNITPITFPNNNADYIVNSKNNEKPSIIEYINKSGKQTWTVTNYGGTTDRGEVGEYLVGENEKPILYTKPFNWQSLKDSYNNGIISLTGFEHAADNYYLEDNPQTFWNEDEDTIFYTVYNFLALPGAVYNAPQGNREAVISFTKLSGIDYYGKFTYYLVPNGCSYADVYKRINLGKPTIGTNEVSFTVTNVNELDKIQHGTKYHLVADCNASNDVLYSSMFTIKRNFNIITFSGNGATSGTSPADIYLPVGDTFTFPENPYTKENCTFYAWYWDGDPYQPGETENFNMYGQPKLYDTPVVIEAGWQTNTPQLTYDYASGKFTGLVPGFRYSFYIPGANTGSVKINDDGSFNYDGSILGKTVKITAESATSFASNAQTLDIHACTPATEWSQNETHHWKACTDANCPITENANKLNYAEHIYDGDLDFTCNTCGYEREKPSLTNVQISPLGIITGDGFTGAAYYRISCNGRNLGNFKPMDGKIRINLNLVTSVYGVTLNTGDTANISIVALNSAHEVISAEWTDSFIVEFDQGIVQIWNSDDLTHLENIKSYTKAHTAVIMSDFTTSSSCYFDVNKDFTIDLNGHTLKLSGHLDFTPESAVNFEITDTSTEKTGKLVEMSPLSELIYLSGSETYSGESTLIIDGICIEGSTATRTVSAISNYATHAINLVIKNTTIKDYYQAIGNASQFSDIKISDTVISVVKNAQGYLTNSRVTIGEILDTNQKLVLYNTTQDCVYDTPAASTYANTLNIYSKTDTQDAIEIRIAAPIGVTVSGSATSFNSDTDDVVLQLIAEGTNEAAYEVIVNGNSASYSIEGVEAGTYTLKVMKKNHVTREYTLTVGSDNVTQDVEIWLLGDVTGDGKVNPKDHSRVYAHVNKTNLLTGYALLCADVTGDGKVNPKDHSRLYAHVSKTNPLW